MGFCGFQLAEEKWLACPRIFILPILQQPFGHSGHTYISIFSPAPDPFADLPDQRDGPPLPGIIRTFVALGGDQVPRLPSPMHAGEGFGVPVVSPVLRRFFVWRCDDELINLGLGAAS